MTLTLIINVTMANSMNQNLKDEKNDNDNFINTNNPDLSSP